MEAERVVLASFIAVTFVFLTALLIVIDWAAAKGRLQPQSVRRHPHSVDDAQ